MVGRIMVPNKGVHILILGNCKSVVLHGKKNFAEVIKFKDLEMGRLPWIVQVGSI